MRTTLIDIINIKKICILQQKKVPTTKKKITKLPTKTETSENSVSFGLVNITAECKP